ncbi:galactose oxidase-like domain-containing protein [Meiothermus taiwanensis]|uniref:Galactose oxidase n=1 Tax=Meiothermus taiwanensis WR-220 TaxID=1339250 RepID=A0ABN5M0D7_9DEIN|nr:PA14 domain-containing protein [Meiothermus taiwanensis]AWR87718.1 galactose oxidase [Meiothermus taiwanensis WR-220]KIQ54651.1 galactose oxidase [Meiothermus taiwanensis]
MKEILALPGRFLLVLAVLSLAACNTTRPPATPANFQATADATPRVVLRWEAVAGAVDYVLERKTNGGAFTVLGVVTSTDYTDENVDYSTTYTYRLTARNNAAVSGPAEQNATTPERPLAPPDTPASFQATADATPRVVLRWTAPQRVARYVLERRARDGEFVTLSSTLPASTTEYTDTAVGSGTPYTYRLTPYNAAGSASPATVLAETPAYSEPGFTQTASSYSLTDDRPPGQNPYIHPLTSPDNGLDVEYFDNPDLTSLFARRIETDINHTFSGQPPLPGMGPDTFSIRWIGLIEAPVSGTYTFTVLADDGVRLWVNDQLLIGAWFDQNLTRRSATISLQAGQTYRLKLEYYNRDARGAVKLRWAYPGQPEQVVPPSAFVRHKKASIGYFGPKLPWPTVATHAVLLPDGRVMTFHGLDPVGKGQSDNYRDYSKHASTQVFVWTPGTPTDAQSQARYDNKRTDLFCVGYVLAANGKLYMAGGNLGYDYSASGDEFGFAAGHTHTNIFDPSTNTWSAGRDMEQGRWYPSVITLPNEEMLIIGGNADQHNGDGIDNDKNYIPDVWNPFTNTLRRLTGASSFGKGIEHFYPWVHVAPNGQVFLSGSYKNWYYLDTNGAGAWTHQFPPQRYNRYYGSSVMYEPGKILVLGGGWVGFSDEQGGATAQVIELNPNNQSVWVRDVAPMAHKRTHLNATLMPDGRIFVNGGNEDGVNFSNATAVYESEIWSPLTETFKRAAEAQCPRTYHSTALLLLDGTIITMGGGATGGDDPPNSPECDKTKGILQKVNQLNAEIYYPPYLHNADGSPASRPVVQSAPERISYGQSFTLNTDVPATVVERVTLVAFGAVTHAFNMGQRFIELSFTRTGPNTLQVTAPQSPNLATPGYYQLYVLDGRGVPSEARVVRLRDASRP